MPQYLHWHPESGVPTEAFGTVAVAASGDAWDVINGGIAGFFSVSISRNLDVQLRLRDVTADPEGSVGIALGDRYRAVAVSLRNNTARWVDSTDYTIPVDWSETRLSLTSDTRTMRLRKIGTERWVLDVDGVEAATLPYLMAPMRVSEDPHFRVGQLEGSVTSSSFVLVRADAGSDMPVAPLDHLNRTINGLRSQLRKDLVSSRAGEGIFSALTGSIRRAWEHAELLRYVRGTGRVTTDSVTLDATATGWTIDAGLDVTNVRDRARVTYTSPGWVHQSFGTTRPEETTWRIDLQVAIRGDPSVDGDNDTGISLRILTGAYRIIASLYRSAGDGVGWRFGSGGTTQGLAAWHVDHTRPHRIELLILSGWVLLCVDRAIVDRVAVTDFPVDATAAEVGVGLTRDPGVDIDVEGSASRWLADPGHRSLMRKLAAERYLFSGGAEPDDELREWLNRRFETFRLRGTDRGLRVELARFAGGSRVYIVTDTTVLEWRLGVSFPPDIWIGHPGSKQDIYIEFSWVATSFTLARFGEIIRDYFLPISVGERIYWACVIVAATTLISPGSSVTVPTEPTRGIDAGDTITLRSFDNSTSETVVVESVTSSGITCTEIVNSYSYSSASPPIFRKVLGRS